MFVSAPDLKLLKQRQIELFTDMIVPRNEASAPKDPYTKVEVETIEPEPFDRVLHWKEAMRIEIQDAGGGSSRVIPFTDLKIKGKTEIPSNCRAFIWKAERYIEKATTSNVKE